MGKESMKYLVYTSIISADNDKYTEDQKQEVMSRYNTAKDSKEYDWNYILEPVDPTGKLAELLSNGN